MLILEVNPSVGTWSRSNELNQDLAVSASRSASQLHGLRVATRLRPVPLRRLGEGGPVVIGELTDDLRWNPGDQDTRWDPPAWRDYGPGRDQGARPNHRTAEHDSADPDECPGLHPGTVDHRTVAQAHPVIQNRGLSGIGVKTAQVLDIAVRADLDPLIVASQHGAVPDVGPSIETHLPDYHGPRSHPRLGMNDRGGVIVQTGYVRHAAMIPWA